MRLDARALWTGVLAAFTAVAQPAPSAGAQPVQDGDSAKERSTPAPQIPAKTRLRPHAGDSGRRAYVEQLITGPSEGLDANTALDEMLDEFAADVARLGSAQVSPILIDRVGVSDNMNPDFARILQTRLVAALQRVNNVAVYRCYECDATTARIENAEWVVSRGIVARSDLMEVAKRYQSQVVMTADVTLNTSPPSMALDVQLVRASDSAIVFAEGYRIDPYDGLLYRTADRVQARETRLKDLEDRLHARPHFKHQVLAGLTWVHSVDHPEGTIQASYLAYRLMEAFGVHREWRAGVTVAHILNPARLSALAPVFNGAYRITPDSLYLPTCHAMLHAGFFMTLDAGNLGNVRGNPLLGGGLDCTFGHRFGAQLSVTYVDAFPLTDNGYSVGGSLMPTLTGSLAW